MKVDLKKKVRLLSELMTATGDFWKVVGITEGALKVFRDSDFKKTKGVQRAHHLKSRDAYYQDIILNPELNYQVWWEKFKDFDKTILATSGENRKNQYSNILDIDGSLGLFRSYSYSWKHNKQEKEFLKDLYAKHIAPQIT